MISDKELDAALALERPIDRAKALQRIANRLQSQAMDSIHFSVKSSQRSSWLERLAQWLYGRYAAIRKRVQ